MEWILNIFIFILFVSIFLTSISSYNAGEELKESRIKIIRDSCEYIYEELTKYDLKQYIPKIKKMEEDIICMINNYENIEHQKLEKLIDKIKNIEEQILNLENNPHFRKQHVKDYIKSVLDIYITSS